MSRPRRVGPIIANRTTADNCPLEQIWYRVRSLSKEFHLSEAKYLWRRTGEFSTGSSLEEGRQFRHPKAIFSRRRRHVYGTKVLGEFRWEMYNALNHRDLGFPNTTYCLPPVRSK